jgi:hypothetical protein
MLKAPAICRRFFLECLFLCIRRNENDPNRKANRFELYHGITFLFSDPRV